MCESHESSGCGLKIIWNIVLGQQMKIWYSRVGMHWNASDFPLSEAEQISTFTVTMDTSCGTFGSDFLPTETIMCVMSYGVCQICPSSSAPAASSRLRTSELSEQLGSWLRPREQEPAGTPLSDRSGQKRCVLGSYRLSWVMSKTLWNQHLRWLNSCVEFPAEIKNKIAFTC